MHNDKVTSRQDQPHSESKALQILAFLGPIVTALATFAWAVSVYFIQREKYRARIELGRLEFEAKKHGFSILQPGENLSEL